MEYFLGLTFDPSSIYYTKVQSFISRFESKFNKSENLQLILLPPFSINFVSAHEERNFVEDLQELLEGHLYGLREISQIEFNGITFSMGKIGLIALTPIISPDIIHCQESLYFFLKEYGVKFKNNKSIFKPTLLISRLEEAALMEESINAAKSEFSNAFVMHADRVVLFEKTPREWKTKNNLYDFEHRDHFFS